MKIFLSHNSQDKPLARTMGGQLVLAGADVWFDEWEIRAGDSIPGRLNEGLSAFSVFVLIWSEHAARSTWVRGELETAIARGMADPNTRIIPVVLDQTPLPAMLSRLRYIQLGEDEPLLKATQEILGLHGQRELIKALQAGLDGLGLDYQEYWGVGLLFGCPKCGAGLNAIEKWEAVDEKRDDMYIGARCRECNWSDGSER